MTAIDLIAHTAAALEASGYWTRILALRFPQRQYPIARIEFGFTLSDGTRERAIGTASVYRDGQVIKSYHL